jgi:hypothetical protein
MSAFLGGIPSPNTYKEGDMLQTLTVFEVPAYLREKWGVHLDANALGELRLAGRGPAIVESKFDGPHYTTSDLDRWAQFHFPPHGCEEPQGLWTRAAPTSNSRPTWFVACNYAGPDADYIRDQVLAFGCNVLGIVDCPRRAIEQAGSARIDATYLDMDWNVEAGIIVAHTLTGRGIPFAYATGLREVPGALMCGGASMRYSLSFDDLVNVIRRHFPQSLSKRMDLTKRAEWNCRPPAHEAHLTCLEYLLGACECDRGDPACRRGADRPAALDVQDGGQPDLFTGRDQAA